MCVYMYSQYIVLVCGTHQRCSHAHSGKKIQLLDEILSRTTLCTYVEQFSVPLLMYEGNPRRSYGTCMYTYTCMCVGVCIYIYIYIYIYTHTRTHIQTHTHTHTYTHIHRWTPSVASSPRICARVSSAPDL